VDGFTRQLKAAMAVLVLLGPMAQARAEPWISVRSGQPCQSCHSNGSGGGMRTAFGNAYALNTLSARPLVESEKEPELALFQGIRFGGNARYSARQFESDDVDGNLEFATDRVSLYGLLRLNEVVDLYIDEQVAPGGSLNREAWARLTWGDWYLKGGKFFLPYGWRLEDDTAYVRQVTGINFASPDNGLEVGYETARLQAQLSVTNGSGGGSENDDGKFFLFRGNWIFGPGQLGINAGFNDGDLVERTQLGVTAGFNTGPVAWLAEYDRLRDSPEAGEDEDIDLALLEADWWLVRGHNLKLTLEWHHPETGEDRERCSLVWEYFPLSHTQLRTGVRVQRSDDPRFLEGEEYFVQGHFYF